jgi:hypothetical protein
VPAAFPLTIARADRVPRRSRKAMTASALAGLAVGSLALWAALTPVAFDSRDELFEIPAGTWARRMSGGNVEILPQQIRLTLGVRDVLVLKNLDDVPQIFGPTLMMPGQSLRLPFAKASSYQFACTAHANGQMTIDVVEFPDNPFERVAWRVRELVHRIAIHPVLARFRSAAPASAH